MFPDRFSSTQDKSPSQEQGSQPNIIVEKEPVVIEPLITDLNAAGELQIEFDPPVAKVPESWAALFDEEAKAGLSEQERAFLESLVSEVFEVIFVQNSDEKPQSFFDQSIAGFTSAGISVNLNFSDPLLISQGEVPDSVEIRLLKSFFTQVDENAAGGKLRRLEDEENPYHVFTYEVPKQVKSKDELE